MAQGGERDNADALEQERAEQVRRNNEMFRSLGIPSLLDNVNGLHSSSRQQNRRKQSPVGEHIPEVTRVLRSQSARVDSENYQATLNEDADGMPTYPIEEDEEPDLDKQQKKREGRKRTRMHNVYDRVHQPPIKVDYNEEGQPTGDNATEFSNFLSTLVKSKVSLNQNDWRKVDVKQKNEMWTSLKVYYIVDEKLKDWVMGSAAKKWRDFKSDLKTLHFDETKTDEELLAARDERVSPTDWQWLIDYWRSDEAKKRSQQGQQNREKLDLLHTAGSKSYARIRAEMHKENGYVPRRDELFIRTHTRKSGAPSSKAAANIIKEIEDVTNDRPELLEKSIKQGDILSHVLGKERNGYVRSIGLGPSAGDLSMPGTKRLKSTRLQMAEEEVNEALHANALLRERVDQVEHDCNAKVAALMEEMQQMKRMMLQSNVRENVEGNPRYDYNSPVYENMGAELEDSVGESATAHELDDQEAIMLQKKNEATLMQKKNEAALLQKKNEAVLLQKKNEAALLQKKNEATLLQKKKESAILQKKNEAALLQKKKVAAAIVQKKEVVVTQKNHQKGKEVILYNVYRDHDSPVAKATILSIDRGKVVGGKQLGPEYCEVVVNYIIKRDAILPRGVGNMTTMAQAQGRSIAWPYKHLEVDCKSMARPTSQPP